MEFKKLFGYYLENEPPSPQLIGQRTLNLERLPELRALYPDDSHSVEKVIEKTIYIPFDEMIERIKIKLRELKGKFNLILNSEKFSKKSEIPNYGSESLIVAHLVKDLADIVEKVYFSPKVSGLPYPEDPKIPILFVDDAIYSGIQSYQILSQLEEFEIYVVVCVINSNYFSRFPKNKFKILFSLEVSTPFDIYSVGQNSIFSIAREIGAEPLPVYFDHKIAKGASSFPRIYSKLIRFPPDLEAVKIVSSILRASFH